MQIKIRTGLQIVAVIVGLLTVAGGIIWLATKNCTSVIIHNSSGRTISDVRIEYTGGSQYLPLIKDSDEVQFCVNPSGESDLQISYVDGNSTNRKNLGGYFEPGNPTEYFVIIGTDGRANLK